MYLVFIFMLLVLACQAAAKASVTPSPIRVSVRREQLTDGCTGGPCYPGNEYCGEPFESAPKFHLMNQHGCEENDPNSPIFDPVHGVFHHFYQIHLAIAGIKKLSHQEM